MAMKELLRVTLDAAKIREACEAFVRARVPVGDDEEVGAILMCDSNAPISATVIVRKRRVRKAKP